MALHGAFWPVTCSGEIVNEYWEEELDGGHQNQPTFTALDIQYSPIFKGIKGK